MLQASNVSSSTTRNEKKPKTRRHSLLRGLNLVPRFDQPGMKFYISM